MAAKSAVHQEMRFSSDMSAFREIFKKAKDVVVLTGAGISAESGVPTFRGEGGMWRQYRAMDLASPEAFRDSPSLVWEFYHYRRELVMTKKPNKGHYALAAAQECLRKEGRRFTVVTQNVDELQPRAGVKDVVEMHGTLFKTRCTKCCDIAANHDSPICPALEGRGAPVLQPVIDPIPLPKLPRCKIETCGGLLRPHIVWFGEALDQEVLAKIDTALETCDLFLVVGTSAVVYPAAAYTRIVAAKGVPVAEFNLEPTSNTQHSQFYFEGPSGETLPKALKC